MNWHHLTKPEELELIFSKSNEKPVLIFKHSTRCGISATVKDRLERSWKEEMNDKVDAWYLDLIAYRNLSDAIAKQTKVMHQSPQVLIIKNGQATYDASHYEINLQRIEEKVAN